MIGTTTKLVRASDAFKRSVGSADDWEPGDDADADALAADVVDAAATWIHEIRMGLP